VVMTSLLDSSTYPPADFADLYHARWRIEEAFKRIKHRLKLEHISGLSWLAAQQDFGAKLVCDNLNALAIYAAQCPEQTDSLDPAVHYKPNRTYGFALLKRWLPRWLMNRLPDIKTLLAIFDELLTHVIRFIPGKSKPRPKRPKPHLHHAYKSTG
jgi:hypothetical protein